MRIDQVGRTAATALLLDESGEVVTRPAPARAAARAAAPARKPLAGRSETRTPRAPSASAARRGREIIACGAQEAPERARGGGRGQRRAARAQRWPTIQTSASWPQGRTAPFRCQGEGDARVGALDHRSSPGHASSETQDPERPCTRSSRPAASSTASSAARELLVERLPAAEGADVALEPLLFRSDDAVFDKDGLAGVQGDRQGARPRARGKAAGLQVQAQARLQTPHRPPPGADPDRGRGHLPRRSAAKRGQSEAEARPAKAARGASQSRAGRTPRKPSRRKEPAKAKASRESAAKAAEPKAKPPKAKRGQSETKATRRTNPMAHKKGLGSSRNGRDSNAQRLGVKTFAGRR